VLAGSGRTIANLVGQEMTKHVEVYTADAVVSGAWPDGPELRDALESEEPLELIEPAWTPLEQPTGAENGSTPLKIDDIVAVVGEDDARLGVHANWHDVVMQAGPYRISGQLPVLPGFDPGRALTRPGTTFLLLRDVNLELIDQPDAGVIEREFLLINRYAVERVAADLLLGFFFPAAHFETLEGAPAS
jgi:hypothetical protein